MADRADVFELPADWLAGHLTDEVREAGRDNIHQLADITSDAFRTDPFNTWMFQDFKALQAVFFQMIKHVYAPRGMCHTIGDDAAALWMMPSGSRDFPISAYPALGAKVFRHGGMKAIKRVLAFDKAAEPHHPEEPHAYLFLVGVRPSRQGRGLGKRLLQPVLNACDEAGLPAYLENSNPKNRGFYQGLGFQRTELFSTLPGGPPLEGMWRAAS